MKSLLKPFQKGILILSALFLLSLFACGQSNNNAEAASKEPSEKAVLESTQKPSSSNVIQWISMEEAMTAQQKNPKPIFIDVYTDWCGWCKVMDNKTFSRPEVAQYMNENFHSVKFNAEKEKPLTINGQQFEVVEAPAEPVALFCGSYR